MKPSQHTKRSVALTPALLLAWLGVLGSTHAHTCVAPPSGLLLGGLVLPRDLWPPQSQLPQLANLPNAAPAAAVLPPTNTLGSLALVTVRRWNAEGNASTYPEIYFGKQSNTPRASGPGSL